MTISLYFSDDSVTQAHLAELAKYRAAQNTNESAQHIPQQPHATSPEGDICPYCKGERCDPVESTETDHPVCPECGGTGKRRHA